MAVYQEKAKERIKKNMSKMRKVIDKAIEQKTKEADTRQIVIRVLQDMLGWDEFENLTGEYAIRGGFADFVLQKNGEMFAVIEVKPVGINLNDNHYRQARDYAFNEGIEWIILTNSNEWRIYRTLFSRNQAPEVFPVFTVKITDAEMKSADKADLFYLLTEEAARKSELNEYCDRNIALSADSLISHIMNPDILNKIRLSIKKKSGHAISNYEVACALAENVFANDCTPENIDVMLRRVKNGK